MLLAIQILLGVLFAGTGIGLVVDLGKNRMDERNNGHLLLLLVSLLTFLTL